MIMRLELSYHLIIMQDEKPKEKKAKKVDHEQEKFIIEQSSVPKSLWILYCYFRKALCGEEGIPLPLGHEVFGNNNAHYVFIDDVVPFGNLKPISYNCIIAYIWYLYGIMKEENKLGKFRFMDPLPVGVIPNAKLSDDEKSEQRTRALADRLMGTLTNQLVLVPCNVGALKRFNVEKEKKGKKQPTWDVVKFTQANYSRGDIDEVRSGWADCVSNHIG